MCEASRTRPHLRQAHRPERYRRFSRRSQAVRKRAFPRIAEPPDEEGRIGRQLIADSHTRGSLYLASGRMKPGEHRDYFRRSAPDGRTRESTIRLDAQGRFWHDGAPMQHRRMVEGFHQWIRRHPDNGRYVLSNGYDWTYFAVDDAPYFVRRLRSESDRIVLTLSDGSEEPFDPSTARIGEDDALYAEVKRSAPGGPYEAKFTRHAQTSLAPWLVQGDVLSVRIGPVIHPLGSEPPGAQ
jgi:uncharacterized protein